MQSYMSESIDHRHTNYFCKMIIVTGASGLLGSQILLHAARSGESSLTGVYRNVKSLKRVESSFMAQGASQEFKSINWVKVDLLDAIETEEVMVGAKYIIHCAAFVSLDRSDSKIMMEMNSRISENVWAGAQKNKVSRGIHVSSISIFSDNHDEGFINEKSETKTSNLSSYGKSKFSADLIAWRYSAEGLSLSVVYPSVIIGSPAWNNSSSKIIHQIKNGLLFYPPGSTGWVDVRDVSDFILRIISEKESAEKYILNGHNLSFQKAFNDIAMWLKCSPIKYRASEFILHAALKAELFLSLISPYKQKLSKDSIKSGITQKKYSASQSLKIGFKYRTWESTMAFLASQYSSIYNKNSI